MRMLLPNPPRPSIRDAMKWYYRMRRQVWSYEIRNVLPHEHRQKNGLTLARFWERLST